MVRKALFAVIIILWGSSLSAQRIYWATKVEDYSSQLSPYEYSSEQVIGKPNALPQAGDNPNAWLPSKPNKVEFIKVSFEKDIKVRQIAIAESYNPSAMYEIYLYDRQGNEYLVHTFNPRPIDLKGRVVNIYIDKTEYEVASLRLIIDGRTVPGYSGIDAIGVSSSNKPIDVVIDTPGNLKAGILSEKLGESVNSVYKESRPLVAPDGKTLYFSRSNHPDNFGGEDDPNDIWYSEYIPESNKWKEAKNIGAPLNNTGANYISSITPDGNSMTVILGNVYKKTKMKPGVSISSKTSEGWESPKPLEIINAYIEDEDGNYFLANNRKTLVMAVDRYDSYGGKDLYVSFLQTDGRWTEPLNLGNDINTAHLESSPFLAPDNETLYFSSKGYSGYGGHDIYISRRLDDTWNNWTEPENLGSDINSDEDDFFFTIPPSGTYAYYAKSNTTADADIHRIALPIFYQPSPVVSIKGKVVDVDSDKPLLAKISYRLQPEDKEMGYTFSDSLTGHYEILLPAGAAYTYTATIEDYQMELDTISLLNESDYREINRDISLASLGGKEPILATVKPIEEANAKKIDDFLEGKSAELRIDDNILFEFASDYLDPSSHQYLELIANHMKENTDVSLIIEGHTDNVGPGQFNQSLSERRANSVLNYFVEQGLSRKQFEVIGYGASRPIASNSTSEGRSKNRRVEFKFNTDN